MELQKVQEFIDQVKAEHVIGIGSRMITVTYADAHPDLAGVTGSVVMSEEHTQRVFHKLVDKHEVLKLYHLDESNTRRFSDCTRSILLNVDPLTFSQFKLTEAKHELNYGE